MDSSAEKNEILQPQGCDVGVCDFAIPEVSLEHLRTWYILPALMVPIVCLVTTSELEAKSY